MRDSGHPDRGQSVLTAFVDTLQGGEGARDTLLVSDTVVVEGSGEGASSTGDGSVLWKVWAFLVVVISFTPSNLALLCCAAGVLGAMGRRAQLSTDADPDTLDRSYPLLSAVLRGLFVFLIVISGVLVLLENPILSTASPEQYIRFGGLLSLTSFVVNYDPSLFARLLDQVRDQLEKRSDLESFDTEEREEERNSGLGEGKTEPA